MEITLAANHSSIRRGALRLQRRIDRQTRLLRLSKQYGRTTRKRPPSYTGRRIGRMMNCFTPFPYKVQAMRVQNLCWEFCSQATRGDRMLSWNAISARPHCWWAAAESYWRFFSAAGLRLASRVPSNDWQAQPRRLRRAIGMRGWRSREMTNSPNLPNLSIT